MIIVTQNQKIADLENQIHDLTSSLHAGVKTANASSVQANLIHFDRLPKRPSLTLPINFDASPLVNELMESDNFEDKDSNFSESEKSDSEDSVEKTETFLKETPPTPSKNPQKRIERSPSRNILALTSKSSNEQKKKKSFAKSTQSSK